MKKYMAVLFFAALFCACSGVKVLDAEVADNADLRQYKTFDFYNVNATGDTVSTMFNERVAMLKEAIGTELTQRGYVQSANNPELLVNIGVQVDEKVQTRTTDWRTDGAPRYMGQRNYSWKSEEIPVGHYREGTVTIDLVDAFKKKMVWTGAIQGVVSNKNSNAQKNMQSGMKALFEKFPVGKI
jgi:hypothetical protein